MRFKTLLAAAAMICSGLAPAQDFPSKPITFVVPVPPGGATDVIARVMAEEMGKAMKQTIIVDNKAGATGMLGVQAVARAAPDGYTVLVTHSAPIMFVPHLFTKVPYDVKRDLAFITDICSAGLVLTVTNDVPAKTMKEFVAWAQKNKGKLTYGHFGIGSGSHLISAYLDQAFKLGMNAVPYKGEAPMIQDMIGGHTPMGISTLGTAAPFIASGKLRPLAVMADRRLADLPNVPTMAEAGFPGREYVGIGGLQVLAPAGTPAPVLARLEKEARAAIQSPAMKARFQIYGLTGIGNSSQDFRRSFEQNEPVIAKLIKASGAKVD